MTARTVTTSDGVELAVHDLGGDGPPLLLVHATGFHGRVFLPLASELSSRFHCLAPDLRGHGDSGVPADLNFDWEGFGRDLLAVVDGLALDRPIALGHSCGGAAALLAEQARPGTFSHVHAFEPVVFPTEPARSPVPSNLMAAAARARREVFASKAEASANYASKPPMEVFDPRALDAYVEFGFDELADGTVRLKCRREHEALVYEHGGQHHAFDHLAEVRCPVELACGGQTDTIGPALLEEIDHRLAHGRVEVFARLGHFGPLEDPADVASWMVRTTERLRA